MNCPGCGESNEAGMQFCINCGHTLSAPPPAPVPAIKVPGEDFQARVSAQSMVLVCTLCNKTDPLNGQFCVHCGGKTVAGPTPMAGAPSFSGSNIGFSGGNPAFTGSNQAYSGSQPAQSNMQSAQYEIPEQSHVVITAKARKSPPSPVFGIVLGILLGAGLAAGAVYYLRDQVQSSAIQAQWPQSGILIYSNAKKGDLTIADSNKKSFIFARTSANGTLQIPEFSAGTYKLVISDKGKRVEQDFKVDEGGRNIIGYPARLELK